MSYIIYGGMDGPSKAKVRDHRAAGFQQNVPRLDVAVDNVLVVGVVQSFRHLAGDTHSIPTGRGPSRWIRSRRLSPATYGVT